MKKFFFSLSAVLIFFFCLSLAGQAKAAGETFPGTGTGALGDPYLVTSWAELDSIRGDLLGASFKLTVDLSSTSTNYTGIGDDWSPIGDSATPFTGNFDGNGHTINDLTINLSSTDYVGLFGKISLFAVINRLGLENAAVSGRSNVGILVGENHGNIYQSYTDGVVSGRDIVGGLVGGNLGFITNCYSDANASINQASVQSRVGGLVGAQSTGIISSYSSGLVSTENASSTSIAAGGLLATNHDGYADRSFWDIETSGYSYSEGGSGAMGITTAEMGATSTFANVGWDFDSIWTIAYGYPHFQWESPAPGYVKGVEINNCLQLQNINANLAGVYSLTTDIDCYDETHEGGDLNDKGSGFAPLGSSITPFTGEFYGNGHRINGLYINRAEDNVGLFGVIGTGAIVKDFGVTGVEIAGNNFVGALAGLNDDAAISNVYSSGSVLGSGITGGLIGGNNANISSVYSFATTTSNIIAGGLIGKNTADITKAFSYSLVNGSGEVGGLVASSTAGIITNSFWDSEATDISISAGGTGKTSTEMKARSTFENAGWDFDNIWAINTNPQINNNYPYLYWQAPFEIVYVADGHGAIDGPSPQFVGDGIDSLPVVATPEEHYEFDEWSDGSTNPTRIETNVMGHVSINASFAFNTSTTFAVNYTAGVGGTISGSSSQVVIYQGNGETVTAVPNSGYAFDKWSDNSTSNSRSETNVGSDMTINAIFKVVSSGGGYTPPSSGGGSYTVSIPMDQARDLGLVETTGVNTMSYIGSVSSFSALVGRSYTMEKHKITIIGLDLINNIITLRVESEPQILKIKLTDLAKVDLDNDNKPDISIQFASLHVNQAELTIKSLAEQPAVVSPVIEKNVKPAATAATVVKAKYTFKRNLSSGMKSAEIKKLQEYLNANGFTVAKSGAGSKGKETTFFGAATRAAVIKFQKAKKISPANGLFGVKTRGAVNK